MPLLYENLFDLLGQIFIEFDLHGMAGNSGIGKSS
jgi:hypothetical protein